MELPQTSGSVGQKKFPFISIFLLMMGIIVGIGVRSYVEFPLLNKINTEVDSTATMAPSPATLPTTSTQQIQETKLTSREGDFMHTVFFSPDYEIDIETTDLKTHQLVTQHAEDPYYHLVLRNQAFQPMQNVFFKTQGDYRYFVFGVHHYGSAYEVYVASENLMGTTSNLQSFTVIPLTSKGSAYFAFNIINYFPELDSLLVRQGSGDGCGGMYEINLVKRGGSTKTVKKYGSGCTDGSRFLGYFEGDLYFADLLQDDPENWDWQNAAITSAYALSPITGKITPLKSTFTEVGNRFDVVFAEGRALELLGPNETLLRNSLDKSYYAFDVTTEQSRKLEMPDMYQ